MPKSLFECQCDIRCIELICCALVSSNDDSDAEVVECEMSCVRQSPMIPNVIIVADLKYQSSERICSSLLGQNQQLIRITSYRNQVRLLSSNLLAQIVSGELDWLNCCRWPCDNSLLCIWSRPSINLTTQNLHCIMKSRRHPLRRQWTTLLVSL